MRVPEEIKVRPTTAAIILRVVAIGIGGTLLLYGMYKWVTMGLPD